MSKWQIWYMRPGWLMGGRFYREKPLIAELERTHVHVADFDGATPNVDSMRDYKEMIWDRQQIYPRRPLAGQFYFTKGVIHSNMSYGDIMVAPNGDVWMVVGFGFELIGPPAAVQAEQERERQARPTSRSGMYVTHIHHPDPRSPRPPDWGPRPTPEQQAAWDHQMYLARQSSFGPSPPPVRGKPLTEYDNPIAQAMVEIYRQEGMYRERKPTK